MQLKDCWQELWSFSSLQLPHLVFPFPHLVLQAQQMSQPQSGQHALEVENCLQTIQAAQVMQN